jgi:hypothetical protein
MAVRDAALDAITEPEGQGYFRKDDILRRVKINDVEIDMTHMADSIHWDYVVRNIRLQYNALLMPLANRFWASGTDPKLRRALARARDIGDTLEAERISKELAPLKTQLEKAAISGDSEVIDKLARKALASGHGKKTAGYANMSEKNGALVVAKLNRQDRVRQGVEANLEKQVAHAASKGITNESHPLLVPRVARKLEYTD